MFDVDEGVVLAAKAKGVGGRAGLQAQSVFCVFYRDTRFASVFFACFAEEHDIFGVCKKILQGDKFIVREHDEFLFAVFPQDVGVQFDLG